MQKLTYQNIRGQSVTFMHEPYILCKVSGLGFPNLDLTTATGAYQQGESVLAIKREPRNVKLTLHLMAATRARMYQLRTDLAGILSPSLSFDGTNRAKIIYENDYGSWWTWAIPENGLDWGTRIQNVHPSVTLTFACESPYWFGGRNAAVFRATQGGFKLPFSFPIVLGSSVFEIRAINGGHAEATPTVIFYGSGDTPLLENLTTGTKLAFVRPLPNGDVLTITTDPSSLSASVRHANGTVENAFELLDPETSLAAFTLRAGENKLKYTSDTDSRKTEVRLEWFDCFEGV